MRINFCLLLLLVSSCSLGKARIPIIVKKLDYDEIDYKKLIQTKSNMQKSKNVVKDCLHVYLFIPNKFNLELAKTLSDSCKNSNYSFQNEIDHNFFYALYGRECIVNEHYCENL